MRPFTSTLKPFFLTSLLTTQLSAFTIQVDYSYDTGGFFTQARKDTFQAAINFYQTNFLNSFDRINLADHPNIFSWSQVFSDPAQCNQTCSAANNCPSVSIVNPSIPANTIIIYPAGANINTEGGSILGKASQAGASVSATGANSAEASNNAATFLEFIRQRGNTKSFMHGGFISFDNAANWHADPTLNTTPASGLADLFTVALHEVGHILGYGDAVMWDSLVDNSNTSAPFFTGPASNAVYGSSPLIQPNLLAHWATGTLSNVYINTPSPGVPGTPQQTYLDPSLPLGPDPNSRQYPTDLDMAGFQDMGWILTSPVPEPSTYALFFGCVTLLFVAYRKKS